MATQNLSLSDINKILNWARQLSTLYTTAANEQLYKFPQKLLQKLVNETPIKEYSNKLSKDQIPASPASNSPPSEVPGSEPGSGIESGAESAAESDIQSIAPLKKKGRKRSLGLNLFMPRL